MSRIPFERLPAEVRRAVSDKTGAVHEAVTAPGGMNSGVASVLETDSSPVFVKGIPADHPQVGAQRREAAVAPHLPGSCPRLHWHLEVGGWSLLGYEVVDGRHADFTPGSPDLPLVAAALAELQTITAPADIDIKQAVDRWAAYAPPGTSHHFDGDTLLHTDFAPDNILIADRRARLVDWAWPTRGAAWIDPQRPGAAAHGSWAHGRGGPRLREPLPVVAQCGARSTRRVRYGNGVVVAGDRRAGRHTVEEGDGEPGDDAGARPGREPVVPRWLRPEPPSPPVLLALAKTSFLMA
jgi:hypothetical protein